MVAMNKASSLPPVGEGKSPSKKKEKQEKLKHKVTFIDKVDREKEIHSTIFVLSYKKYNSQNTFDPQDSEPEESSSNCCTIF